MLADLLIFAIVTAAVLVIVHGGRMLWEQMWVAAEAIRDLFHGGPRPPSHPLPADDALLLLRRRTKRLDWRL